MEQLQGAKPRHEARESQGQAEQSGAKLVRCVLFEYTRVLPGVDLHEMIVYKDYSVDRDGEMKHVSEYAAEAWANARDRRQSLE